MQPFKPWLASCDFHIRYLILELIQPPAFQVCRRVVIAYSSKVQAISDEHAWQFKKEDLTDDVHHVQSLSFSWLHVSF